MKIYLTRNRAYSKWHLAENSKSNVDNAGAVLNQNILVSIHVTINIKPIQ
jgi:hypothetical protein